MTEQMWICDKAAQCPTPDRVWCSKPFDYKMFFDSFDGICPRHGIPIKAVPYTTPEANTVHYDGQHWREKPMEYKLIKSVSLKALEEAGACERELHRFAFLHLKTWQDFGGFSYRWEIGLDHALELAAQCQGGIEFLLAKDFIGVKKPTYHVGQRFRLKVFPKEYLLARVNIDEPAQVAFISPEDGCIWAGSIVTVESANCISHKEIEAVAGGAFEFIK